jgi:hypothetical protein
MELLVLLLCAVIGGLAWIRHRERVERRMAEERRRRRFDGEYERFFD